MTNKDFQTVMKSLANAHNKYIDWLEIAEDEYIKRFGNNPSEVDDDYWIDTFHVSRSEAPTVEEITISALLHQKEQVKP